MENKISVMEWLMSGGLIVIFGLFIRAYLYLTGEVKDVNARVDKTEDQRKRIYERLDEYKRNSDDKFTQKDVCKILYGQVANELAEIKTAQKELLNKYNSELTDIARILRDYRDKNKGE